MRTPESQCRGEPDICLVLVPSDKEMPGSGDWEAQRTEKRVPRHLGYGILPSERSLGGMGNAILSCCDFPDPFCA